jgi:hypothetical protein
LRAGEVISAENVSRSSTVAKTRIAIPKTKIFVLSDSKPESSNPELPPKDDHLAHRISFFRDKRSFAAPFGATFSGRASACFQTCGRNEAAPEDQISDPKSPSACNIAETWFVEAPEGEERIRAITADSPSSADPGNPPRADSPSCPRRRLQNALHWSDDQHPSGSAPPATQPRIDSPAPTDNGPRDLDHVASTAGSEDQPAGPSPGHSARRGAMRLWRSESPVRRLRSGPGLFATPPLPAAAAAAEPNSCTASESANGEYAPHVLGAPHSRSPVGRARPSSSVDPSCPPALSPLEPRAPGRHSPPAGSDADFADAAPSPRVLRLRLRPCSPMEASVARSRSWARSRARARYYDAAAAAEAVAAAEAAAEAAAAAPEPEPESRRPVRPACPRALAPLAGLRRPCAPEEIRGGGARPRSGLTPLMLRAGGVAPAGGLAGDVLARMIQ